MKWALIAATNFKKGEYIMKVLWNVCAVVILALFFFSTTSVYAQNYNQRERWHHLKNQVHEAQAKIQTGERNGSLTQHEAGRLRNELNRIESHMDRAGQDGLSRKEIERLDREFAKLRRDIYRERHDREKSYPRR
jgi:predicted RNase H-like nuclease (RuvC/YqgF family)